MWIKIKNKFQSLCESRILVGRFFITWENHISFGVVVWSDNLYMWFCKALQRNFLVIWRAPYTHITFSWILDEKYKLQCESFVNEWMNEWISWTFMKFVIHNQLFHRLPYLVGIDLIEAQRFIICLSKKNIYIYITCKWNTNEFICSKLWMLGWTFKELMNSLFYFINIHFSLVGNKVLSFAPKASNRCER
jgi:hypothetical protein